MRVFRNKEVRREATWHLALTAILTGAGFLVSREAGLLTLAAGILLAVLHGVFLFRRYRAIARLSEELDGILIFLCSYSQGQYLVRAMQENRLPLALALIQPDETVGENFEEWELTVNQGIHGSQDNANCLMRAGLRTFGDLNERLGREGDIAQIRNLGTKSREEIIRVFRGECYARLNAAEQQDYWQRVLENDLS